MKKFALDDGFKARILETVEVFERQVLLFPIAVMSLATLALFCSGRCSAWQWWMSATAVCVWPFFRNPPKRALAADALFAATLAVVKWWLPPMSLDPVSYADMCTYHLPMVRLLAEGWNPVTDPSAEGIVASLGLDMWGMHHLHVAFLSKTVAIFCAVAYKVVGDPYALTFPCVDFLWLGAGLTMFRVFKGSMRLLGLVAATRFCHFLPVIGATYGGGMFVDVCMALASLGLVFTMYDDLRKDRFSFLQLVAFSVWMMNTKLTGLLCAFVCWSLFAAVALWRHRADARATLARFAGTGFVLVCFLALLSYIPLGTSWRTYGHPLYPYETADAEAHPVRDISWELKMGNADAQSMGRIGTLSYAYLSPSLTRKVYGKATGRGDFSPWRHVWGGGDEPTTRLDRLQIAAMLAVLFALPGMRVFGVMAACLLVSFPLQGIGYMRYQPWISAFEWLALLAVAERCVSWAARRRRGSRFANAVIAAVFAAVALHVAIYAGASVDSKVSASASVPAKVYAPYESFCDAFDSYPEEVRRSVEGHAETFSKYTAFVNNLKLLMRETGRDGVCEVLAFSDGDDHVEAQKTWRKSPFGWIEPPSEGESPPTGKSGAQGRFGVLKAALHAYFVTYPRLFWHGITSM